MKEGRLLSINKLPTIPSKPLKSVTLSVTRIPLMQVESLISQDRAVVNLDASDHEDEIEDLNEEIVFIDVENEDSLERVSNSQSEITIQQGNTEQDITAQEEYVLTDDFQKKRKCNQISSITENESLETVQQKLRHIQEVCWLSTTNQ